MSGADSSGGFRTKTASIFRELAGERVSRLLKYSPDMVATITEALSATASDPAKQDDGPGWPAFGLPVFPSEVARDVAFHLIDWADDAAFLIALQLFPERFTSEEIADGIGAFLVHAPNHVAAAAVLSGCPSEDFFGLTDLSKNLKPE